MSQFYFAKGVVRYHDSGWVIIEVPQSIVRYYKSVCEKFVWKKMKTSYHGAHVSICSGKHEKPNRAQWRKFDGKIIEFKYYSTIYTDGQKDGAYYWLRVESPKIFEIRKSLGLPPFRRIPYHITVAFSGNSNGFRNQAY